MSILSKPTIREESVNTLVVTDLDTVVDLTNSVRNVVVNFAIPTQNTAGNRIWNVRGKQRTILLRGIHTGAGYSEGGVKENIAKFIEEVELWVNNEGIQDRKRLIDTFDNEFLIVGINFEWNWIEGDPNNISYTIEMVEGGNFAADVITDFFT